MLGTESGAARVLRAEGDGAVRGGGAELGALWWRCQWESCEKWSDGPTFLDSFSAASASILASSSSMKRTPLTRKGRPFCCSHAGILWRSSVSSCNERV